jgi:hypothetical protein
MKKTLKVVAYAAATIAVLIIGAVIYITQALPNVGEPENIKVEITPQRVERGKYLAQNVSACLDCHSAHDWTKLGGPVDTNQLGSGGEKFDAGVGFPGNVTVPNLTPHNLAKWTDGELFRAITTGVKKDGSAIFPLMPWPYYSKMDREDLYAIIAYIRTLKPIKKDYPKSTLDFPLNIIVHTMPQKATLGTRPNSKDTLKYGEYLVQSAGCKECHSKDDKGTLIAGLEFAGDREFKVGANTVRSANITPDAATGLGKWDKAAFIARFKAYGDVSQAPSVGPKDFQTVMPWWNYAKMSEGDLASIYAYLKTLKPIGNKVEKFTVN